jgi:hypothetical protein
MTITWHDNVDKIAWERSTWYVGIILLDIYGTRAYGMIMLIK